MTRKVFFLHTLSSLIPVFNDLGRELLPGDVEILHIADEMLARLVIAQGELTPFIYRRVLDHVSAAGQAGGMLLQATCSSISPCIEAARVFVDIPVLKIDEPMALKAIQMGQRIGIVATAITTLAPTTELVRRLAQAQEKVVEVSARLCEGAYAAMLAGNIARHDEIVLQCIRAQMSEVDVLLLAQASMARVLEQLPVQEQSIPIMTSPRLAVMHLADLLDGKP